jgi:hypothetical protein
MDERAREVINGWNKADSDRGTWKSHWQQIADLCLPERNDYFTERTPGIKRNQQVYDATPIFALIQFANGLHSLLTSQTLRWFASRCDDERIDQMQSVRAWWDAVDTEMYSYFNGPRHNFASQSHELYLDLGSIGTAVMAELESERSGILFSTRGLKECVLFENEEDRVDSLIRKWRWTAKQAVEQGFVTEKVWRAYEKGDSEPRFNFLHSVQPRKVRNPDRAGEAKHKAWESLYVAEEDGAIVREGGFDEFPYHCPRLSKASNEIYGRGCGMTALPDMKMLNELLKLTIKSGQKLVDPPLQIPDDGFLLPIKTVPGSQNYYRANSPAQARITPIETRGRWEVGKDMLQDLRGQINRAFFVEWMTMPTANPNDLAGAGKGVTATWVLQQRDDRMRLLSPLLARLQAEFLGPLIDRTFMILWRKSLRLKFQEGSPFPPPPDVLMQKGREWHVEYVSPIAIAQRSSEMDSVSRMIQLQATLKTLNPNAPDIIDHEAIMRLAAIDLHAPAITLKSPQKLQQEQAAKAQAEQLMAGSEAAANYGDAFKSAGQGTAAFAEAQQ